MNTAPTINEKENENMAPDPEFKAAMEKQEGLLSKILDALSNPVSYTHLRAHETVLDLVCRLLLEKKNNKKTKHTNTLSIPRLPT